MNEVWQLGHVDETLVVKLPEWYTMASSPDTSVTSTSFCEELANGILSHHTTADTLEPVIDDSDAEVTSSSEITSFTNCCISVPFETHADEVIEFHLDSLFLFPACQHSYYQM